MAGGDHGKPFLEAWLRRTRKQLAASGRLSELAVLLAKDGVTPEPEWRLRLRRLLDQDEEPDFELLTRIDALLARRAPESRPAGAQTPLF